jgi:HEAT repeat protein
MNRLVILALSCQILGAGLACAEDLPSSGVRLEGEHLSLSADRMPLTDLLESLNRSASVAIALHGDASRIMVSDSFKEMQIRRALLRVLSAHSHLLIEHGRVDSLQRFEVILLESTDGRPRPRIQPFTSTVEATRLLEEPVDVLLAKATSSAPANERAAAAEAIAYRPDHADGTPGYANQVLLQMLSDSDEEVRARALETIKDTADRVPFDALAQVAREDASAKRRMQALELLVERSENGEAREALRVAFNDPDAAVRERARELVADWHIALQSE